MVVNRRSEVTEEVTARAPAKIDLFFRVGNVRSDETRIVTTLSQAISLSDDVTAAVSDDYRVRFSGPIDTSTIPTDERNLALRTAKRLAEQTGYRGGVDLTIEKRIPMNTGIGGGTANAAATLLACNDLWSTNLSRNDLRALAADMGCDVAAAFDGGTVVSTGDGNSLTQALHTGTFHWVIAVHGVPIDDDDAFAALDEHRRVHAGHLSMAPDLPTVDSTVMQAIRAGDTKLLAESLHSDLQVACIKIRPELIDLLELGESRGALGSVVLGASSGVGFLVENASMGEAIRAAFEREGTETYAVAGPVGGAKIIVRRNANIVSDG